MEIQGPLLKNFLRKNWNTCGVLTLSFQSVINRNGDLSEE